MMMMKAESRAIMTLQAGEAAARPPGREGGRETDRSQKQSTVTTGGATEKIRTPLFIHAFRLVCLGAVHCRGMAIRCLRVCVSACI